MAIAFNALTASTGSTSAASKTFAHDPQGSDRILYVGAMTSTGGNADRVTGVTFGGVAMTRVTSRTLGSDLRVYLYQLVGPTTGSQNVVVSLSPNSNCHAVAISYTGASQTGQPDASGTEQSIPTFDVDLTTNAANCWIMSFSSTSTGGASGGTNQRYTAAIIGSCVVEVHDSGPFATPGANSFQVQNGGFGQDRAVLKVAIAPVATATAASFQLLLDVGT